MNIKNSQHTPDAPTPTKLPQDIQLYSAVNCQFYCNYENPTESCEHSHSAIQITLPMADSSITVHCHEPTGKTTCQHVNPGEIHILDSYHPHQLECRNSRRAILFYLEPQFLQHVIEDSVSFPKPDIVAQHITRDPLIYSICTQFRSDIQKVSPLGRLYLDSLANVLAIHLVTRYSTQITAIPDFSEGLSSTKLKSVLDYIHSHLDDGICLDDLANHVHLSRYHFMRLFKQSIGVSPYQYLIQERIKLAKELLLQQDLRIIDIAYKCGFSSQSHFTKCFKKIAGVTPKLYRDYGGDI